MLAGSANQPTPLESSFNKTCFYFYNVNPVTKNKYSSFILKFGGKISDTFSTDCVTHVIVDEDEKNTDSSKKCILRPRKATPVPSQALAGGVPMENNLAALSGGAIPHDSENYAHPSTANQPPNSIKYGSLLTPITSVVTSAASREFNFGHLNVLSAIETGAVTRWSRDDLRNCLLREVKKRESLEKPGAGSKNSLSLAVSSAATRKILAGNLTEEKREKQLAEYLAEEKKAFACVENGLTNRNCLAPNFTQERRSLQITTKACFSSNAQKFSFASTNNATQNSASIGNFKAFEGYFILVEDVKQEFKPLFKEYSRPAGNAESERPYPKLNWDCPIGSCPFTFFAAPGKENVPVAAGKQSAAQLDDWGKRPKSLRCVIEDRQRKRKVNIAKAAKHKNKNGFCECCYEMFADMEQHSNSARHRAFAACKENFVSIDLLLASINRPSILSKGGAVCAIPQSPRSPIQLISDKRNPDFAAALEDFSLPATNDPSTVSSDATCLLLKSPCVQKSARSITKGFLHDLPSKRNLGTFADLPLSVESDRLVNRISSLVQAIDQGVNRSFNNAI